MAKHSGTDQSIIDSAIDEWDWHFKACLRHTVVALSNFRDNVNIYSTM